MPRLHLSDVVIQRLNTVGIYYDTTPPAFASGRQNAKLLGQSVADLFFKSFDYHKPSATALAFDAAGKTHRPARSSS